MATEDYKGQFKSLSKDLGLSVKEIRAMPDYDLEMLIEHRRDLREQAQTIREMGGAMNKGGMPKKKAYAKGGKVAMYSEGGMVKNTGELNTGIKRAKNTYK